MEYSTDGGTTWSPTIPTGKNAGPYTVSVKYVGDANHEDFQGDDINVTIAQKEVTLDWSTDSLEYNGNPQAPTATAGEVVSGDTVEVNVSGAETNVGTGYIATATGLTNANYKLPTSVNHTFAITKNDNTTASDLTADQKATRSEERRVGNEYHGKGTYRGEGLN